MTPDEARHEILELARATQAELGGRWTVESSTWFECDSAAGAAGATFAYEIQRGDQPLPGSAEQTIARVRTLWHARGVPATITLDSTAAPPTHYLSFPAFGSGTAPDGFGVLLTVSDAGPDARGRHLAGFVDFEATSRCVEGDAARLDVAEAAFSVRARPLRFVVLG